MLVIGLTGGIASGKSTIAALFAAAGAPLIDADHIAHELVIPGKPAYQKILEHFGPKCLGADNKLNRAYLREIIFQDLNEKLWLENLLHPLIKAAIQEQLQKISHPYCIVIIPLLIEVAWFDLVDRILLVDLPAEIQLARLQQRDHLSLAQAQLALANQTTRARRLEFADDIIENSGDLAQLHSQILHLDLKYQQLA